MGELAVIWTKRPGEVKDLASGCSDVWRTPLSILGPHRSQEGSSGLSKERTGHDGQELRLAGFPGLYET